MSVPNFTFSLSPTSVLISQTQQLVLTVSNQTGATISCGMDLTITLTLPVGDGATDLVAPSGASAVTAAPQNAYWSQNVDTDGQTVTIEIYPARNTSMANGDSLIVLISSVAVNGTASTPGATVPVQTTQGSDSGAVVNLTVGKISAGQTLSAYANPVGVAQGQATTIFWTATGGSHVQLWLGAMKLGDTQFTGDGPIWSGSFTNVRPYSTVPQTTFTVTVLDTSGANTTSLNVVVSLESPLISSFTSSKQTNLLLGESVNLAWATQYGASAYLTSSSGGGSTQVALQATAFAQTPSDWIAGTPNSSTVVETLSVTGYLGPVNRRLPFAFAPAAIQYFSYATMDPSDGVATPVVFNGKGTLSSGADTSWTLTLVGPGGPLTRSIGTAAPSVNYFGPAGTVLDAPADVTLSYWVNGLVQGDTLTLNGQAVTVDSDGKGSTVVSPTATTSYTLMAVLSGQTILNTVTITINTQSQAQVQR